MEKSDYGNFCACCACVTVDRASAALPTSVMNSRRFMGLVLSLRAKP